MSNASALSKNPWYEKGRLFKRERDYNNAIICFQSMLRENAQDPVALGELYKCCLLVGREKEGIDTVNKLMLLYLQADKKMECLTLFGELMQLKPHHTFDQDVQIQLVDWLHEVADYQGALAAIDNYAKRYPHDKRVPDMLLRAATISRDQLHDKTLSKSFAARISESYPESRAAEEAAMLFFESKFE